MRNAKEARRILLCGEQLSNGEEREAKADRKCSESPVSSPLLLHFSISRDLAKAVSLSFSHSSHHTPPFLAPPHPLSSPLHYLEMQIPPSQLRSFPPILAKKTRGERGEGLDLQGEEKQWRRVHRGKRKKEEGKRQMARKWIDKSGTKVKVIKVISF